VIKVVANAIADAFVVLFVDIAVSLLFQAHSPAFSGASVLTTARIIHKNSSLSSVIFVHYGLFVFLLKTLTHSLK
jgi:hypothetical protein